VYSRRLIVHPKVQHAHPTYITELVRGLGLTGRQIATPHSAAETRTVARQAARDGLAQLLVAGGDGTIHAAVQELAGTRTRLGIIPCGTSNDLAGSLGITEAPARLTPMFQQGCSRPVDLLRFGEDWVATAGGLGLAAEVARAANECRATPRKQRAWSWLGGHLYSLIAAREIIRHATRSVSLRVTVDGEPVAPIETTALLVSRVPSFGGGLHIADAQPTARRFAAAFITARARHALLATLLQLRRGQPGGSGTRVFPSIATLDVHADGLVGAFGDGEYLGLRHRLSIRIVPSALHVLVPNAIATAGNVPRQAEAV
jgi:diacylglycerol kinase (ATP)